MSHLLLLSHDNITTSPKSQIREFSDAVITQKCITSVTSNYESTGLLRRLSPGRKASPSKRGRKAVYDIAEVKVSLKRIWAAMNFACSKLVQAAMPEWLGYIEKHYGAISDDSKKLLLQMSAATIDRLLSSARADSKHGRSGTKPGF